MTEEMKLHVTIAHSLDTVARVIQQMITHTRESEDHSHEFKRGAFEVYGEVLDEMKKTRLEVQEKIQESDEEISMLQSVFPAKERAEMTVTVMEGLLEMIMTGSFDHDDLPEDMIRGAEYAIAEIKDALYSAMAASQKSLLDIAGEQLFGTKKKH